MRKITCLLALLLVASFSFATCPAAVRRIDVPAVVGGTNGWVMGIEVETRPGNGTIYASVMPNTGTRLQNSLNTAAAVAFARAGEGRGDCDVLLRVADFGDTKFVDGPSAGAAMTIALEAALMNKTMRNDVLMTGTIEPDGSIGQVGGTIEKAIAISEISGKKMLTPFQEVYERMILLSLRSSKNISIVEVRNIAEVEQIVFSAPGTPIPDGSFEIEFKPLPQDLAPIELDPDLQKFKLISSDVVDDFENEVNSIPATDNSTMRFKDYFEKELAKQRELGSRGYVFSAANSAFLLTIDVLFLKKGFSDDMKLGEEKESIAECISSLGRPNMTRENFQWVAGADVRRQWATRKLNETGITGMNLKEEEYKAFRELQFARSWCEISSRLSSAAGSDGQEIDERSFKALALAEIEKADEALSGASTEIFDEEWHLDAAKANYNEKKYAAAAYDAAYAFAMLRAREEFSKISEQEAKQGFEEFADSNPKSLWAKIYQGQAKYIYASNGKVGEDTYKIAAFAIELESVTLEMGKALGSAGTAVPSNETEAGGAGAGAATEGGAAEAEGGSQDMGHRIVFFTFGALSAMSAMAFMIVIMSVFERKR